MVKFIARTLGLNEDNFSIFTNSVRISKRRLKIQWKINSIKKKFRTRKQKYILNLENKNENDIITLEPINKISRFDLLILNINNKLFGISSSNLLKWMETYEWDEIPKNPFTNLPLLKVERKQCLKIAKNFLYHNLHLEHLNEENKRLKKLILNFSQKENYRRNPKLKIDLLSSILFSLQIESSILVGLSNIEDISYFDLQNFDEWCDPNTERNTILQVKGIGYMIQTINLKIEEIEEKIINKYFI